MSIHDFHSKLVSGKAEGTLFEALRRLKGRPALATGEEPGWAYWSETEGATAEPAWAVWQEGSEAMSEA
ncbi:MAG TPA: hypothetical protein VNW71_16260 [Thermoanaerobaculia bacterium]|nr:hypothetical protein [Thermoanaerobaculia bacterium]